MVNATDGLKWGIVPRISTDLDSARQRLYRDPRGTGRIEAASEVQLTRPLVGNNFTGDPFFSNGKTYLFSVQ